MLVYLSAHFYSKAVDEGRLLRVFLLIVGAMAVAFLALRTAPTPVESLTEVQAILEDGQPTLVEFYSNT